jgi:hypothetical protein
VLVELGTEVAVVTDRGILADIQTVGDLGARASQGQQHADPHLATASAQYFQGERLEMLLCDPD